MKMLVDIIEYNAGLIEKNEGKPKSEAEYLAICVLLDDLSTRPMGEKGYQIVMKRILPVKYPQHNNDVRLYLGWKRGLLHLKPEVERELLQRHKMSNPSNLTLGKNDKLNNIKKSEDNLSLVEKKLFGASILVLALQKSIYEYKYEIKNKKITFPAYERSVGDARSNLRDVWEDLILEAYFPFFLNDDKKDILMKFSDIRRQKELIPDFVNVFEANKAGLLSVASIKNIEIALYCEAINKLKNVWRIFRPEKSDLPFLTFSDICVKEIKSQELLNFKGDSDREGFTFDKYKSVVEILHDEIVRYSKEIAICTRFGSRPRQLLENIFAKELSMSEINEYWKFIHTAKTPDDLIAVA